SRQEESCVVNAVLSILGTAEASAREATTECSCVWRSGSRRRTRAREPAPREPRCLRREGCARTRSWRCGQSPLPLTCDSGGLRSPHLPPGDGAALRHATGRAESSGFPCRQAHFPERTECGGVFCRERFAG